MKKYEYKVIICKDCYKEIEDTWDIPEKCKECGSKRLERQWKVKIEN